MAVFISVPIHSSGPNRPQCTSGCSTYNFNRNLQSQVFGDAFKYLLFYFRTAVLTIERAVHGDLGRQRPAVPSSGILANSRFIYASVDSN